MVEIVDDLWLCEDASYGFKSHLKGAVEEARRIAEREGGIAAIRDRLEQAETKQRQEAKDKKAQGAEALRKAIRQ